MCIQKINLCFLQVRYNCRAFQEKLLLVQHRQWSPHHVLLTVTACANSCTINSVGFVHQSQKTLAGSRLMTSPTNWEWLGIAAVLGIPPCKSHSAPAGRHFSPFHLPRSGNGNDIPLKRGKNSPPWRARGATWRASCRNEIPVRDEWAVRGMLGKKGKEKKVCAAAGLRLGQSQKPAILVLLSNFDECWTAVRMMDSVKRYIGLLDRHLCIIVSTFSNRLQ